MQCQQAEETVEKLKTREAETNQVVSQLMSDVERLKKEAASSPVVESSPASTIRSDFCITNKKLLQLKKICFEY